jgi:Rrf2 family protein
MELSRQADYAIRAISHLATLPEGQLVQTREIALSQDIPDKYLPTIVRTLARAGLLRTLRGSHGGVSLARPAAQISLWEVVEAIDGPVLLNRCMIRPGECKDGDGAVCVLHNFWLQLVAQIQAEMEAVNFRELKEGVVRLPRK